MKNTLLFALVIALVFSVAAIIIYAALHNFKPDCYTTGNYDDSFEANFNEKFVKSEYAEIKDLGKSFLTLLIAVFVASITFSEKIVVFNSTSQAAKSFLVACWVLFLLSIVFGGLGLAYSAACYNQALHVPCPENINLYRNVFFCFVIAGLFFGLGLASMLCAGLLSFMQNRKQA